jgi:hypothetical protein
VLLFVAGVSLLLPSASFGQRAGGGQTGPPIDSDQLAKGTTDANYALESLGKNRYSLYVQNTSNVGYINSFDWVAGPGLTVTAVTGASNGKCALKSGAIACVTRLSPPKCTCAPGGAMTIDFTMAGDQAQDPKGVRINFGSVGSYLAIKTITPVPYHIPSSRSAGEDANV